jgi:rhamnose transport system substrate-binding protein
VQHSLDQQFEHRKWRERVFPNGEWLLLAALLAEIVVFSVVAPNFFSAANFFEVIRFSVELGLIAIALTPVIITGGINLSVGSMMGLAAVAFGALWQDAHFSLPWAGVAALLIGCAGGFLNALLIVRTSVPPLVVTLGSFSLFRGIAEGITHGATNYTGFPPGFLFFGQGYLWGVIPVQVLIFAPVILAYFVLLHRSIIGRALYVVGFTASGARYAGIPVSRRIGLVYVLSGAISSLAAIVYIAHLGQARADAGTGYESDAITAVVLGGTSVFGGRGTLWGTLFGLFFLTVLQNGLHLAALPSELTGVLTGVLLVTIIGFDRARRALRPHATATIDAHEERGQMEKQSSCDPLCRGAARSDYRCRNQRVVGAFAWPAGKAAEFAASPVDRNDAEGQRRSLFCERQGGRRRSRQGARS